MGKALAFRQYESIVEVAKGGGHTLRYTSMRLANVLEWLFDNRSGNSSSGSIEDETLHVPVFSKL